MHGPSFVRGTTSMATCEQCKRAFIVTKLRDCEPCQLWLCADCYAAGDHDLPDEHHHTRRTADELHRRDP